MIINQTMEYINITTIIIALIVIIIIVFIIVLRSTQKAENKKNIQDNTKHKRYKTDEINISKIFEYRIQCGIEEAIKLAENFEEKLAKEFSELDYEEENEKKLYEISEKLEKLKTFIQFLNEKDINLEVSQNFVEFAYPITKNSKTLKIINYLYFFQKKIDSDLLILFKGIIAFDDLDEKKEYSYQIYNVLFENINKLKDEIKVSIDYLSKPKTLPKGIAIINRAIIDIQRDINKQEPPFIFEFVIFKQILDDLSNKVEEFEIKNTESPTFEIKLIDEGPIEISEKKKKLNFSISNKKHNKIPLDHIDLLIQTDSNDFVYEKTGTTRIKINKGKAITTFTFHTYYFDENEYDKNPNIEFKIYYQSNKKTYNKSCNIKLPDIKPTKTIPNPFEEGVSGKELSGTSELFFGRTETLSKISKNLLNFKIDPTFYLLIGVPRCGKSSILNQLAYNPKWLKNKFISLKVSTDLLSSEDYFRKLFSNLIEILEDDLKIHVSQKTKSKPKNSTKLKVNIVKELLSEFEGEIKKTGKKILFLIDEYQRLAFHDTLETDKDKRIHEELYYQFPGFIKSISDEYREIANVIITGYEDFIKTAQFDKYWVQLLGGRFLKSKIDNFSETETKEFLKMKFENYGFTFTDKGLNLFWLYTAGNPFLSVKIGYHLFDSLIEDNKLRDNKEIGMNDIHKAVNFIAYEDIKYLWFDEWIFNNINARLIIAYIGDTSYDDCFKNNINLENIPEFNAKQIKEELSKLYNINLNDNQVDSAINTLRDYGLIYSNNNTNTNIILRYPLFAELCRNKKLLESTIDEYRRVHNEINSSN